jgi:hypothetical protein
MLHLLLHPARGKPPAPQSGLQDVQEKVSLCLPVQVVQHQQQRHMSALQKPILREGTEHAF